MLYPEVRKRAVAALSIVLGLLATVGFAESRLVCFRIQLRDDRVNCATPGETGARRACDQGSYVDMVGHQIELWDKDTGSTDELVGTWYIGGAGSQCISFEWENAQYSKGEPDPDLYLRYVNVVNRTQYSNFIRVKAVDTDGSNHPVTTWRNGQAGDPDRFVARNCQSGVTCMIFPSGTMVPTNDVASERGLWIMALDSAQHTIQAFGEVMDTHVDMHYPGQASCPTSCAVSRTEIHITQSRGNNGFNVAHEVGHVIQMQEFNQDSLRNDCSQNGGGWNLTSDEFESCATAEGWASFVGVTSWYEPNNTGTTPMGWGRDFERATPQGSTCSGNSGIPIQVAKAFWDLDDWNNEDGAGVADGEDDRLAYNTLDIARGWRQFGDGTSNRQDFESDSNGVNMRDYYWNNTGRFTATGFFETFLEHNCLESQDNN